LAEVAGTLSIPPVPKNSTMGVVLSVRAASVPAIRSRLPSPSTSAYANTGRPPLVLVPNPSAVDGV
jgi:hypothetical protein